MHDYENPRQISESRLAWEEDNRYEFEKDFAETQQAGIKEFGIVFVKAQEAAMGSFGGIYRQFDTRDFYTKALFSRIVLSTLRGRRDA